MEKWQYVIVENMRVLNIFLQLLIGGCEVILAENGNSTGKFSKLRERWFLIIYLVEILQNQVNSLTHQVSVMTQSYEELIEELRERNSNGLIFLPFETLHQKILLEGTFGNASKCVRGTFGNISNFSLRSIFSSIYRVASFNLKLP